MQVSDRMKAFQEELNDLCDRYLVRLEPQISNSPSGILPVLAIIDIPPKPQEVAQATQEEPKSEEPKVTEVVPPEAVQQTT